MVLFGATMRVKVSTPNNSKFEEISVSENRMILTMGKGVFAFNLKKYQKWLSALESGRIQYLEIGQKRYEIEKVNYA